MDKFLCLAAGSLAGGFARWLISDAVHRAMGQRFPSGTFLVNISGCLLMGFLHGMSQSRLSLSPQARMLLMVGFCGAFTTFSTWMLESSLMMDRGNIQGALAYMAASVLFGFILFRAGYMASVLM